MIEQEKSKLTEEAEFFVKEVIKEDPEFHQKVHRSHVDRVANTLKT